MQKEKDFLKKKKLTNKELTQAMMGVTQDALTNDKNIQHNNKNIQFLAEKVFLIEGLFTLLLEHDKEFNKIVMKKAKEVEKTRSADKKGT